MSGNSDPEELKAKYAEIAALKKAIEKKMQEKGSFQRPILNTTNANYGYGRSRRGGYSGIYKNYNPYRPHINKNMSSAFKDTNKKQEGSEAPSSADTTTSDENTTNKTTYISTISSSGLSLVNSDIYEKERERKAIEKERINKLMIAKRRNAILKNRISKFRTKVDSCDRVNVDGDPFAVTRGGNKLIPLSIPRGEKSKTTTWFNKTYQRKHNGTLKCQIGRNLRVPQEMCRYFVRTGLCQKGSNCKYTHDTSHIRVCRQYLKGVCSNKNCLLSHTSNEYNTPLCRYYLENKCLANSCRYQHHKPEHYGDENYDIWICRPFAIGGWCERGSKCPFLHLFHCPDFEEENDCPRGSSCTLTHVITKRTQKLMESTSNTYERDPNEDVVVNEEDGVKEKNIINSYTVPPDVLFITSKKGKYDIFIDNDPSVAETPLKTDSEFTINFNSDDYSTEEEEIDGLEENNDYIKF